MLEAHVGLDSSTAMAVSIDEVAILDIALIPKALITLLKILFVANFRIKLNELRKLKKKIIILHGISRICDKSSVEGVV